MTITSVRNFALVVSAAFGATLLFLSWVSGLAAEQESLPTAADAVVSIEVRVDPFSAGPALLESLSSGRSLSPYEAELARRLNVVSTGSGFIINEDGDVVTNAHVIFAGVNYPGLGLTDRQWRTLNAAVLSTKRPWVILTKGGRMERVPAEVVALQMEMDLAVLKPAAATSPFPWLPLGDSDKIVVGQSIITWGYPKDRLELSKGTIRSLISGKAVQEPATVRTEVDANGQSKSRVVSGGSSGSVVRFQHSAATAPGSSGGPILDEHGRVVGLAYAVVIDRTASSSSSEPARPDDLNLAIAVNVLKKLLSNQNISYHAVDSPKVGKGS